MVHVADVHLAGSHTKPLNLRMTSETKVHVPLRQQFGVNRAVWVVTNSTPFTQGRVLENEWTGLFPVTLAAVFVLTSHRQPAGRFKYITAMRVVALSAVHLLLQDRMMLWQLKLRFSGSMTLEAGGGILPGIHNELSFAATSRDMQTRRSVAGFATGLTGGPRIFQTNTRVRTARKHS
jgi:hypothetical protein